MAATANNVGHPKFFPGLSSTQSQDNGPAQVSCTKQKFEVKVDVHQFTPEELSVKTIDNYVVIEGKHEEKREVHGLISRHFVRRYLLPEGVQKETIQCTLSTDGLMIVSAPRMVLAPSNSEFRIPINETGQPFSGGSDINSEYQKTQCGCSSSLGPKKQPSGTDSKDAHDKKSTVTNGNGQ